MGYSLGLSKARRWSEKQLLTVKLVTYWDIMAEIHLKACFSTLWRDLRTPESDVYYDNKVIGRFHSILPRMEKLKNIVKND